MDPTEVSGSGVASWTGTPFGGDEDVTTHSQPAPPPADKDMPGEQPAPRWEC
jgi:hypothetical protein